MVAHYRYRGFLSSPTWSHKLLLKMWPLHWIRWSTSTSISFSFQKLNAQNSIHLGFPEIFWTSTPRQNPKPRAKVKHKKKSQNCRREERPKSSFQMKRQKLGELCKRTHSKVVKLKKLLRLHRISLSQQKLVGSSQNLRRPRLICG